MSNDDKTYIPGVLWAISCKLHGIGDLIQGYESEPPLNRSEVNYGIGQIIIDLATELETVRNQMEGT